MGELVLLEQFSQKGMAPEKHEFEAMAGDIQKILSLVQRLDVPQESESKIKFETGIKSSTKSIASLLKKISARFDEIDDLFEDLIEKIFIFGTIQRELIEIIEYLDEEKEEEQYLLRSCIILHDIIKKIKSENIEQKHLKIFRTIIQDMNTKIITKNDFVQYDNCLLDAGLDWILIEG